VKLQISGALQYTNLDLIRTVVENSVCAETVAFTHEHGAGRLVWHPPDGHFIAIGIPQSWLDVRENSELVVEATRNFVRWVEKHSSAET
jgi:hypothetical protein